MLDRRPGDDPAAARAWYGQYNRVCNDHRFGELGPYVAPDIVVNGTPTGLDAYIEGLGVVSTGFRDYRWRIDHVLVDGDWLAVHLFDTGTHTGEYLGVPATGREVSTHEFSHYRLRHGLIAEVWVTADDLDLLRQLRD